MNQQTANRARAHREPFLGDRIDVLLIHKGTGRPAFGMPVCFAAPSAEPGITPAPTFSLEPEAAQQLMDELWHAGIRPTEGTGSAGSLAATERHLSDMRALVFKTTPKP